MTYDLDDLRERVSIERSVYYGTVGGIIESIAKDAEYTIAWKEDIGNIVDFLVEVADLKRENWIIGIEDHGAADRDEIVYAAIESLERLASLVSPPEAHE